MDRRTGSGSDVDHRAEFLGVSQASAQAHGGVGYNIKKKQKQIKNNE